MSMVLKTAFWLQRNLDFLMSLASVTGKRISQVLISTKDNRPWPPDPTASLASLAGNISFWQFFQLFVKTILLLFVLFILQKHPGVHQSATLWVSQCSHAFRARYSHRIQKWMLDSMAHWRHALFTSVQTGVEFAWGIGSQVEVISIKRWEQLFGGIVKLYGSFQKLCFFGVLGVHYLSVLRCLHSWGALGMGMYRVVLVTGILYRGVSRLQQTVLWVSQCPVSICSHRFPRRRDSIWRKWAGSANQRLFFPSLLIHKPKHVTYE